jgi:hypothetical protein
MKKILFLSLLVLVVSNLVAQSTEEKVLQRVKELNTAIFSAKDSVALEGLLADKLTYGHSTGKIEDRPTMISGAVHSNQTYSDFVMDSASVFFQGNNTAIVRHVLRAISTADGKQTPLHLNVLQVWVKQDKQWKLTARQAVKL